MGRSHHRKEIMSEDKKAEDKAVETKDLEPKKEIKVAKEKQEEPKKEAAKSDKKNKSKKGKKKVKRIRSKKYDAVIEKVDPKKEYTPAEATALVKELSTTSFDGSVEAHVRLNFDTSKESVRGNVSLPHGTGKSARIIVFADEKISADAKKAGAIEAGGDDLVEKIQKKNWLDFDIAIAHPTMMPKVGKLGKILGTKGLMPNPKAGTVTPDIVKAVEEFSKGKVEYKADANAIVHQAIGKVSFDAKQLEENLATLVKTLNKNKPPKAKGKFFESLYLTPTMGPSVKVDFSSLI